MVWCDEITQILGSKFEDSVIDTKMVALEEKSFKELNELAGMVRGQLSQLDRATLCALITIDVHARDIVSSMVRK